MNLEKLLKPFLGFLKRMVKKRPAPEKARPAPIYLFDWNEGFSTHPDYQGERNLPYGYGNKVTLDGRDISNLYIRRLLTGNHGWVEYRDQPALFTTDGAEILWHRDHGVVTWEYIPDRKQRD